MNLIVIPKMRMNQLQSLAEQCYNICKPIPALADATKELRKEHTSFIESMQKDKASKYDKRISDNNRDAVITGFYGAIRAEQYYPHTDPKTKETLEVLARTAFKYGKSITKLSYNEETATIDNILSELKELDLSPLKNSDLVRWIPLLEEANKDFKKVASDFSKGTSAASFVSAAVKQAPILENALKKLLALMFSHITISQDTQITKAYNEINLLIDSL